MSRFVFETDCINSTYEHMRAMLDDHPVREITLRTFAKAIGPRQWKALQKRLGYDHWFRISKDWHVGYYKGIYRGRRCYFLTHSGIEYIYTGR